MFKSEALEKKWQPILEAADAPKFADSYRKSVTAVLLENQQKAAREAREQAQYLTEEGQPSMNGSAVDRWDPVLISLVRRAMPNLIAYDVAGVQPMTGPTGLIFAMKSRYNGTVTPGVNGTVTPGTDGITTADSEALFNEANPKFSGDRSTGGGLERSAGEGDISGEMGFTIEKKMVEAKTRQLKAEYSMELAQDLKAIHGLDAETELANILSTEILAEINREVIGKINMSAVTGGIGGDFDLAVDADGRWAVEKFKSLLFQIEREANAIAKATRRGKGNFVICSSNVASALAAAGVLDYAPALSTSLNVDDTGNTFAGIINGRLKVFIDPYSTADYITVGYKGSNAYDAGIYYCPYVPLTMVRAVDQMSFQPKIGFKTRYGLVANPFSRGNDATNVDIEANTNVYFRNFSVTNINSGEPNFATQYGF
jgi:nucleoside diphosphate kinase